MRRINIAIVLTAALTGIASAHVSFKVDQAKVGAEYDAVLRVPHGCAGKPTDTVRVRIPDGVILVEPAAKEGWNVNTRIEDYRVPVEHRGQTIAEGAREIIWNGGSLEDKAYDEFRFRIVITADLPTGSTPYFPVVQQCGDVAERWIEIPKGEEKLHYPAPGLEMLAN